MRDERSSTARDASAGLPVWQSTRPWPRDSQQDVSTREAAAILGRSERSVQRAVASGAIAATRVGTAYRISRDELTRLAAGASPPPAGPPPSGVVALPAPATRQVSLPESLSSFVGRQEDLQAIIALLHDPTVRLVTLTGPGGIGKTRLATAAAGAVPTDRFPDGVVFVALADLRDPNEVIPATAQALGLRPQPNRDPAEHLRTFLRRKHLLLMLDNFEHLLPAGSEIAVLVAGAPGVTALVTSRAPLRVTGEREVAVQPLTIAGQQATPAEVLASDAGRLFTERAREHDAAFVLDDASAPVIAELCARLDGLPLAIELAAARIKVLPPRQLLTRLERRLPLLTRGPRDAPARHGTMHDAIAWSYDLLSPPEQRCFRWLAVPSSGVTLEAAAALGTAGDAGSAASVRVLDVLADLVDQSLLVVAVGADGERRFSMLETIREFGLDRLAAAGEEPAARAALAAYMVGLVTSLRAPELVTTNTLAHDQLVASHADLQSVLTWLEQHDATTFVRLVAMLPSYWYSRGLYREALDWLPRALARAAAAAELDVARLRVGLSRFQVVQGDYDVAASGFDLGIPALRRHGSKVEAATAIMWRAGLAMFTGDDADAEVMYAEADRVAALVDDPRSRAALLGYIMNNLGVAARGRGEFDLAETRLERALAHFVAHDETLAADESSLVMGHIIGDELGHLALDRGAYTLALQHYQTCLEQIGAHDDMQTVDAVLVGAARAATALKQVQQAARLFAMADALRQQIGLGMSLPGDLAGREQDLAAVRSRLGESAFAASWREGRPFSLNAARSEIAALVREALPAVATSAGNARTPWSLTRRESDVLRLLAEHKSDREIAEALFLSPRTVNWHVRAILGKLDVRSRREAIAHARAHGLVE